jgi:hypothetical protein
MTSCKLVTQAASARAAKKPCASRQTQVLGENTKHCLAREYPMFSPGKTGKPYTGMIAYVDLDVKGIRFNTSPYFIKKLEVRLR